MDKQLSNLLHETSDEIEAFDLVAGNQDAHDFLIDLEHDISIQVYPDVATALHVSAYSFKSLSMACIELMPNGGSIVGLDFDATVFIGPAAIKLTRIFLGPR